MAQWLQPSPWGIEPVGITGWWFFATPLKNDGVRQLGYDDIPNMMGKS